MKTNQKLILAGLLGVSGIAEAQAITIGLPLVRREEIQKISEQYQYPDMEKALLEAGIIREVKLRDHYFLVTKRLNEEAKLSRAEKDEYIMDILKNLNQERINVSLKSFQEMMATTQDFSPMVHIDATKMNERFQKREQ